MQGVDKTSTIIVENWRDSMFQDTIAAIATADAMGAISVIRISGSDAIQIVTDLTGKDFSNAKGYTIHYATIKEGNESVDEVLVSLFRAPKILYW